MRRVGTAERLRLFLGRFRAYSILRYPDVIQYSTVVLLYVNTVRYCTVIPASRAHGLEYMEATANIIESMVVLCRL